ncbi:hypothetical protein ACWGNE_27805 [Streptomyces xiamenensis]
MSDTHFTAWLVNDLSALETEFIDITVIEDELIGGNPEREDDWASQGDQVFHAVTSVSAEDGDIDDAKSEARHLIETAGWRIAGEWRVTSNAYLVTVERA